MNYLNIVTLLLLIILKRDYDFLIKLFLILSLLFLFLNYFNLMFLINYCWIVFIGLCMFELH